MYGGSDQLNSENPSPKFSLESKTLVKATNGLNEAVESNHSFSILLELAADNDLEAFKQLASDVTLIGEVGLWFCYHRPTRQMILLYRTPLMIAAEYGSVDVVKYILSLSKSDVNQTCGPDKSTALHCAASGGSSAAVDVIKFLLHAGADPNAINSSGHCPSDIIVAPPIVPNLKVALEELLRIDGSINQVDMHTSTLSLVSRVCSVLSLTEKPSSSVSDSTASSFNCKPNGVHVQPSPTKKEYPIDPSIPGIKSSIFANDDFRLFSYKIQPCSRAYSHDWTECPFVHPGENARRRDLKKFHYSCMPCPDYRSKGTCRRGDSCEYAHGVFESWMHPSLYRTQLCKDSTSCTRKVCFFAHTYEELRPLYECNASTVPSPSATFASAAMDMYAALKLLPGSPSAATALSSSFTPPLSPKNGIPNSPTAWPEQNILGLHLLGGTLQMSRLRSALNASDISTDEIKMMQDFDMQQRQLDNLSFFSQSYKPTSSANYSVHSKPIPPLNLDEHFSAEVSSPWYSDQFMASPVFSPSHKSTTLNQQQQQQSMLSPIKRNAISAKIIENARMKASLCISSPRMMSPRTIEPLSSISSGGSIPALLEKQQQQLQCFNTHDLESSLSLDSRSNVFVGSPRNLWSKRETSSGKVNWSVQAEELSLLRKPMSVCCNAEEPDVSWVHSLVKESPSDRKEMNESSFRHLNPC